MSLLKRITRANYYRKMFFHYRGDLKELVSVLEDQTSVDTLNAILNSYRTWRRSPGYYYLKAASAPCTEYHFMTDDGYEVKGAENPYFLEEIFDLERCQVLLDGGAYIGDTIEIAQKHIPNLRLVYAFEPNAETYGKLTQNGKIRGLNVQFLNYGLGKHDGEVRFKNEDARSMISEDGSEVIHVLEAGRFVSTLSKDDLPDFIKLDIEGAETDVLDSLGMFIEKYQPDMAVSIYHRLEDLWSIPLKLKQLCPEYHIYIRHQSNYYTETVCYATIHSPENKNNTRRR